MTGQPVLAAIAVVAHDDAVILVRRKNKPDAGLWGFPGGKVEFGETVFDCAMRELMEETGVKAEALSSLTHIDVIRHGTDGEVEHHFLLVAILCKYLSGYPQAADDAAEAAWISFGDIRQGSIGMSSNVADVAEMARSHYLKL